MGSHLDALTEAISNVVHNLLAAVLAPVSERLDELEQRITALELTDRKVQTVELAGTPTSTFAGWPPSELEPNLEPEAEPEPEREPDRMSDPDPNRPPEQPADADVDDAA